MATASRRFLSAHAASRRSGTRCTASCTSSDVHWLVSMGNRFSSGKHSIAECDRCGFRFKLSELKIEVVKTKPYQLKVCKPCWDPDQPQLSLGLYPVNDPQAVREPRPDTSYQVSGNLADGYNAGGSRVFQWGWNPVGGAKSFDTALTPNYLAMAAQIGTVTVTTT